MNAPEAVAEETVTGFDKNDTVNLCRQDLNFFAGIAIPEIFKYFYPAIFIAIWNLLVEAVMQEKGMLRLAIGLPRGFAKTAFLKIYVVWCVLFTKRNFILIVCNTEPLSHNFVADVFDILSSPNIKALFGDWSLGCEKDTQGLKKFGFRGRDIIVAGVGAGTSLRGINLKFRRPDVVIMDDMQNREQAENKLVSEALLTWMLGTLLKARNYERCLFVFVGNMYPFEGSILKKLKYNPQWISFICGGILADGKSLWEELRPIADLLADLDHDIAMGRPEIFYSEVQNDEEAGSASGFDVSKIPHCPAHLEANIPDGGVIIIDPASGKATGNDVAIGAFYIYDNKPVFRRLANDKFSPLETIHAALKMAFEMKIKCICVESNAYQSTLLFWFNFVCQQLNISGIDFCELNAGGITKNAKIRNGITQLIAGEQYLHEDVRSKVLYQIVHWNPLRQNNDDDVLDLFSWIPKAVELYRYLMELAGSEDLTSPEVPPALLEMNTAF